MKKVIVILVCIIIVAVLLLNSSLFKSDTKKIEERIEQFSAQYNDGDLEGVLECFDTKTRNMLSGTIGLGSSFLGFNMNDLFGLSVGLLSDEDLLYITIDSIEVDGSKGVVYARIGFRGYMSQESDVVIHMAKEGFKWYISDMK